MSLLWTVATEQKIFHLPTGIIEHYDPPDDQSIGDDGWSKAMLREHVRQHGIQKPIEVGMSETEMNQRGNDTPYAFNGNHRLSIAKELGHPTVPCVHSDADDALPLSDEYIKELGGG